MQVEIGRVTHLAVEFRGRKVAGKFECFFGIEPLSGREVIVGFGQVVVHLEAFTVVFTDEFNGRDTCAHGLFPLEKRLRNVRDGQRIGIDFINIMLSYHNEPPMGLL